MEKKRNVWVALNRATDEELRRHSKAMNYVQLRGYLTGRLGSYVPPPIPKHNLH